MGAAVLFSTGGTAIKASSLDGLQLAGLRSLVAAVALLAWNRGALGRPGLGALPVAAAYAGTTALFVAANKLTTAANAIFLQSTAPLHLLWLGPLLLRERARRSELGFMAWIALGLALVLGAGGGAGATASNPGRGDLLALLSGLCWAVTLLGLRAARAGSPLAPAVLGNLLCAGICLGAGGLPGSMSLANGLIILYLGTVQVALANLLMIGGLRRVAALEASLILLVEPALVPFWAYLVLGEGVSLLALGGGALILAATALRSFRAPRAS